MMETETLKFSGRFYLVGNTFEFSKLKFSATTIVSISIDSLKQKIISLNLIDPERDQENLIFQVGCLVDSNYTYD